MKFPPINRKSEGPLPSDLSKTVTAHSDLADQQQFIERAVTTDKSNTRKRPAPSRSPRVPASAQSPARSAARTSPAPTNDPYPIKSPSRKKKSPPLVNSLNDMRSGCRAGPDAVLNRKPGSQISPLTPLSKARRRPRVPLIDSSAGATPPPHVLYTARYINKRNTKVAKLNEMYKSSAKMRGSVVDSTAKPFPKMPSKDDQVTPELSTPPLAEVETDEDHAGNSENRQPTPNRESGSLELLGDLPPMRKSVDGSPPEDSTEGDFDAGMAVRHMKVSDAIRLEDSGAEIGAKKKDVRSSIEANLREPLTGTETSLIGEILREPQQTLKRDVVGDDEDEETEIREKASEGLVGRLSAPDYRKGTRCAKCCCSSARLFLETYTDDGEELWRDSVGQVWNGCKNCGCCKAEVCECQCLGYNRNPEAFRRASEGSHPSASTNSSGERRKGSEEKKEEQVTPECTEAQSENDYTASASSELHMPAGSRRRSISEPRGRPDGPNGLTGPLPKASTVYYTVNPAMLDDQQCWPESQLRRLCSMVGIDQERFKDRASLCLYLAKIHRDKLTISLKAEDLEINKYTGVIEGGHGLLSLYFKREFLPKKYTKSITNATSHELISIVRNRNRPKKKGKRKIHFSPYNECKDYDCDHAERKGKLTRLVEISTVMSLGVEGVNDNKGKQITPEMILVNPTMELTTDPQWCIARQNMFENIRMTSVFERRSIDDDDWFDIFDTRDKNEGRR